MSILSRNLISNRTSRVPFSSHSIHTIKTPNFSRVSISNYLPNSSHLQFLFLQRCRVSASIGSFGSHRWQIKAFESNGVIEDNQRPLRFNFDYFLSVSEVTCLVSAAVVSIVCLVNLAFFKQKNLGLVALGNRVLVWLLAGAVVLGTAIRRRQWRRVCGIPVNSSAVGPGNVNVIQRIEKLEESLRSATTIIHMLSRQLEKLGIRFRVTRRTLKDPIAETAALAQKNSEIARTLAAQEDRLEKELVEVQKVLLAMQDQQQKQLELILTIAKSGKLLGPQRDTNQGSGAKESHDSKQKGQQVEAAAGKKGKNNDKV
ncbi:hypothetical protein V2J09_008946 [Rumex salicifolius]